MRHNGIGSHMLAGGDPDVLSLYPGLARARRYLFFTNECVGLGHLRRSMGLARAVTAFDPAASALVVTGSPAVSAYPPVPRVETAKLPQLARNADGDYHSPVRIAEAGHMQSMRARLAMTFAESFEPDVIVVDKTPAGINGELLPMLKSVRASGGPRVVLGLRDIEDDPDQVRRTWSATEMRSLIGRYYDSVLVYGPPGSPDALTSLRIENLGVPVHHVGYVTSPLPDKKPDDLPEDYLLVTMGGGVDGAEVAMVVLEALRRRPLGIATVLVTGPMMSADELVELTAAASGLDVVLTRFRSDLDAAIVGARAVVTMAGYNTVAEVLRAGRPALLVPRVRPSAEQWVRASMLAERGLVETMHPDELNPDAMRACLDRLLARPVTAAVRGDYGGAGRAAELLAGLAATVTRRASSWVAAAGTGG
jgi:predicted glycosyltransferase